jgi:CDP-4-dehydro-6-deoxyglucose reductase, E3
MTYHIKLEPSGNSFDVEDGQTILRAGLDAGLSLPYSCASGVCSTCRSKIIEGEVDFGDIHPSYLNDDERAQGFVHMCLAKPLSDMIIEARELSGLAGVKIRKVPCRIAKLEHPAPDVTVLHLRLPLNENMRFVSGQHIEFILPGDVRRRFSIANKMNPEGVTALELHIRHVPDGLFTGKILPELKERALMRFEGPLGSFALQTDTDKPIVLVASGTGFSPIKSICESAFDKGINKTRPMTLYWGGRTRQDLYMLELAQQWAAERENFSFVPVLSEPAPGDGWTGRTGFVHQAAMDDIADMSGMEAYACGAPLMVDAARRDFTAQRKLPQDAFYADAFLSSVELGGAATEAENER